MDLRKIKKLIELVEESKVVELEVSSGDESIRISMGSAAAPLSQAAQPIEVVAQGPAASSSVTSSNTGAVEKAPMAGVFYAAPSPDAEPFVGLGQRVSAGDVLCIIESMKMMNEIVAKQSGTVSKILAGNGEAVSTGMPLFAIS
jgi:acetyl-CoA carboxylase biotin carboxyl carrier protein